MGFAIFAGVWLVFGALIGYTAASKRGFSPAAGMLGGVLLGCAAPLMFLVSADRKRCAACAEWIQKTATACRFCGRDQGASAPREG